jgi:cell division protein FtsB
VLAAVANVGLAFRDAWTVKSKVDQLEQELAQSRERNEQTRRQIRALQSDPRAIEQVLRIRNKVQPGEEVLSR